MYICIDALMWASSVRLGDCVWCPLAEGSHDGVADVAVWAPMYAPQAHRTGSSAYWAERRVFTRETPV
ncbi:MAG: hypothetical protein JW751_26755 [Polyangiaceae bacterium]|nr:hypothetical protein [Polyangiaceae bacterium]